MGKNRKYVQSDYYFAQKNCKNYLESLTDTSKRMGRKLTKFVDASKEKLKGKEFDILRKRLQMYSDILNHFSEAVDILSNNIVSSDNKVCNTMGAHTEVTDQYIEEINEKIKNCNSLIYSTNKNLATLEDDAKEKEKDLLSQYNASLAELREEKNTMLELIKAVEAADNGGISSIDDVMAKLTAIKSGMLY